MCCAVMCCAVLCCAVLCCAVLCCAVLCCAVLCCSMVCSVAKLDLFCTILPTDHRLADSLQNAVLKMCEAAQANDSPALVALPRFLLEATHCR